MPLRLKTLELQGYKTFATRTTFEFAGTVTAVVGPNGSGKSNIADSLRWVLGEQSFAVLRGKKTEDMIFAGSESRPRASMASATITFDNGDGWLPIDFSEVTVTRRAYRDGQNEYLINDQRVRLKDVSELLAQSGLAERTYTIIGQGLVDAALALKAEERRRLFEEAAGIGLHRTRREEALRRLETTRRNLERVQDILAELKPRLSSLERQARRAQEYDQVKADLRVLLRDWYGFHWHRTQAEVGEAREASRLQDIQLDSAREEQARLSQLLAEHREKLQHLRGELNTWHRQASDHHRQREEVNKDIAVAEERIRSLREGSQENENQLRRLGEEMSLQRERLEETAGQVGALESELVEAQAQSSQARKALLERQAQRGKADKELADSRQALGAANARQGQLQARLVERQAQLERNHQSLAAGDAAVRAAETEEQNARQRLAEAEEQRTLAEQQHLEADAALQDQRRELAALEAGKKAAQERRSASAAEQARLNAQRNVLEQAEAALSGYAAGTKLLLQASRQKRLPAVRNALSALIEVPADLEQALSAALGDFLDAVVLEDDADSALDLLQNQAARGVLLPLPSIQPASSVEQLVRSAGFDQASVSGLAANLVKAPDDLRAVVNLLLGNILVVRDRQVARQVLAWAKQDHSPAIQHLRIVTLAGEVFLTSGPVMTYKKSGEDGKDAGLLGRARQRRQLEESLAQVQTQLREIDASLAQYAVTEKQLQAEETRLAQRQREARQAAEKAGLVVDKAKLAVEGAAGQLRWQIEQRKRLQTDLERGQVETAQLTRDLNGLEEEIRLKREQVRERSAQLANLQLDDVQAQAAHWNTQTAVAERALADGRLRLKERQQALENATRGLDNLKRRQSEMHASLEQLDGARQQQLVAQREISEKIDALRVLIDPAEAELLLLEQVQAQLETTEAAARSTLGIAEHHHAQTRMVLARRQEALQSLQRRVEEDFGLVAFEYARDVSGPTPLPLDGMVEQLPVLSHIPPELDESIKRLRAQMRRMGAINPEAQVEYTEVKQRYEFLTSQVADLHAADISIREVIQELDSLMQKAFKKTFSAVAAEFRQIFTRLFGGGSARLVLTDPEDLTNTGIDIEARLPGRREQGLSLLSGGERSLTAAALVFALLRVSPTPFCVLDEVDAMLDEANVGRFRDLLGELSQQTQFIVVTHNRNTVQVADVIYGITMGRDSASQILSLKMDQVEALVGEGKTD